MRVQTIKPNIARFIGRQVPLLAATLLLSLTTLSSFADDTEVFPIHSRPYGKSYGQWATAWWQWVLGIPAANNPLLDSTGAFAGVGQHGPVWFLGASLGGSEERTFTIPAGKGLFLPVTPWIFGSIAGDCGASNPGVTCDVPTLRSAAAAVATSVQTMEVSIDGEPVDHLRNYRALSPDSFSVTLPDGNFIGLPAGTYGPQVADGYWLMLAPLEPGTHTIRVHIVPGAGNGSEFDVIYHIRVKAPRHDSSESSD
jgi:hypothetical protein